MNRRGWCVGKIGVFSVAGSWYSVGNDVIWCNEPVWEPSNVRALYNHLPAGYTTWFVRGETG